MQEKVIVQKWEESERGWGTRPDGHSLHLSEKDRKEFIYDYWQTMPDSTPNEYSRPTGKPFEIKVSDEFFLQIENSQNGIRHYGKLPRK